MRCRCPHCGRQADAQDGARTVECGHCGRPFSPEPRAEPGADEDSTLILPDGAGEEEAISPSDLEQVRRLFRDKYEVLGMIGRGGMGAVYRVRQKSPRRLVALKVLLGGYFATEEERRRFKREAQAIALLQHPGIVRVYEFGEAHGQPYFTMDHVEGTDLRRYVRENSLDQKSICRLMAEACEAIEYAHREGVIHADLKPGNILVDREGRPRVLDFGLARIVRRTELSITRITAPGTVTGTPEYMSPEQTVGDPDAIDERTDVYSLGVILYELVTGHLPYRREDDSVYGTLKSVREEEPTPPRAFSPGVDRELEAILYACLEKDRDRRYPDPAALRDDLERYVDGLPVSAVPPTFAYRLKKALRRNYRTWVPLATGIVLVVIAAVLFVIQMTAESPDRAGAQEDVLPAMGDVHRVESRVHDLMSRGDWMKAYMTAQLAAELMPERAELKELPDRVASGAREHAQAAPQRVKRLVEQRKWVEAFHEAMLANRAGRQGQRGRELVSYVLESARGAIRPAELQQRLKQHLQDGEWLEAMQVVAFAARLAPGDVAARRMRDLLRRDALRRMRERGGGLGPGAAGRDGRPRPRPGPPGRPGRGDPGARRQAP